MRLFDDYLVTARTVAVGIPIVSHQQIPYRELSSKKVSEVSGVFGGFSPKAVDCYNFSGEIV